VAGRAAMAIEPVKRLWLVVLQEMASRVLGDLYRLGCVHLATVESGRGEGGPLTAGARPQAGGRAEASEARRLVEHLETELSEAGERLQQLSTILSVFDEFAPSKKQFLAELLGLPLEVERTALDRALASIQVPVLAEQCGELRARYQEAGTSLADVRRRRELWEPLRGRPLRGQPVPLVHPSRLQRTALLVGWLPRGRVRELDEVEDVVWEVVLEVRGRALVALAAPAEARSRLREVAVRVGLSELAIPEGHRDSEEYLAALAGEEQALLRTQKGVREEVEALALQRVEVLALVGYWERVERRAEAVGRVGVFGRVVVIKGYVREQDLAKVAHYLADARGVAAVYEEPTPGEEVPVSLRTARIFAPAQFLVRMFGLPPYFSFDPTPYLTFSFLLFFGICFGDAIYGVAQVLLALWLARKVWEYVSLRQMFLLFAYAGVATIVMGVLTGSWCANLYDYLGEGNLLLRVKQATAVFNPLDKPVLALLIALGLGVANQLWAVVLRMYGSLRQRDYAGAVFDSGLWLIFLPGLVLLISAVLMVSEPAWVKRVGLWLVGIGGVGLVLTQGRNEKGFFAKALTGVVSLYGILGTYGGTTFVGDVLSYCRLLALALTTTIVGWSFNIVADLLRGTLGWWGFIPVVIVGHSFNFCISILTGFVHSARLIFVEFFGRFYSGGAPAFVAFGRERGRVRLREEA